MPVDDKIKKARDLTKQDQDALKHLTELHAPKGGRKALNRLVSAYKRARGRLQDRIAKLRKKKHEANNTPAVGAIRQKMLAYADWGSAHEPLIHYQQSRPIDGLSKSPPEQESTPLYTDCSGFVTKAAKFAGAPDPNGFGFNGSGYTGTILNACQHISKADALPGDYVVYGPGTGQHVVMLLEPGSVTDPLVVSHGQEAGPFKIRNSVEISSHSAPVTYCRAI